VFTPFFYLGEMNYSLVLEYADGGTLGKYLENAITLKSEVQLKFAKEIASAILCLHANDIIHRDIVSLNNYIFNDLTFMLINY
jgi:serine/threonine protein kinase